MREHIIIFLAFDDSQQDAYLGRESDGVESNSRRKPQSCPQKAYKRSQSDLFDRDLG
jgi:hypothetical protein